MKKGSKERERERTCNNWMKSGIRGNFCKTQMDEEGIRGPRDKTQMDEKVEQKFIPS